ncbi:hypothetical protein [Belnapia rosea]|uniref:Uncharacterized protein n=1 Tax=Belnapia rosea TaxID=938405 RepID=A0A1G6P7D5_9PROT|nr:hypothetical protein [Belnapia rosea]SDB53391.1 hypothetical protein SAMN02927895_01990 [Belnapia rosea]SDC75315.1 hypothetical protein SAMN04487779_1002272 [Belnapia rosea]
MTARLACLLLLLGACSPTTTPIESSRIERGTALPPPGLDAPAR